MLTVLKNRRVREGAAKRDSGDNQAARAPQENGPFLPAATSSLASVTPSLHPSPPASLPAPPCLVRTAAHPTPTPPSCPVALSQLTLTDPQTQGQRLIGPAGPWPPGWLLLLPVVTVLGKPVLRALVCASPGGLTGSPGHRSPTLDRYLRPEVPALATV